MSLSCADCDIYRVGCQHDEQPEVRRAPHTVRLLEILVPGEASIYLAPCEARRLAAHLLAVAEEIGPALPRTRDAGVQ